MKYVKLSGALVLALVFACTAASAEAAGHPKRKDDSSRSSKNGILSADVDGVAMTLTYGRPKVKSRKVWGSLVSFGKVWRAGADEATAVTFAKDVKIDGKKLPAGSYALFVIPNKDKWTLVFNSVAEQWGAYSYDSKKDVLRVDVKTKENAHTEELTFVANGNTVELRWEKIAAPFTVKKS